MENSSCGQRTGDGKSISPTTEIDSLLAGVGYSIRPSDLRHVEERLEKLDSAMIPPAAAGLPLEFPCSDAVHYNPSDLSAWVDSMAMLTEFSLDTWTNEICQPAPPPQPALRVVAEARHPGEQEAAGIRLIHLLLTCADSIQRDDRLLATKQIEEMQLLLPFVEPVFSFGKVAVYFVDALNRRLRSPPPLTPPAEDEILYQYFYLASPYLKFAHFTANQAILDAFNGQDRIHIIDFSLMDGLQWPALIQALALRPDGPPFLRLTGIGQHALHEVGQQLADMARSVGVPFTFHGVVATRLNEVLPWRLRVEPGEAVAVNSVLQLHRLLGDPDSPGPIDSVLSWLKELRPKIVILVEQEADHNRPAFRDRFTKALFYYSTMFDSLEAAAATGGGGGTAAFVALAEVYLQREICNIVCCEGIERVERHEPMASWRTRFGRAGLRPIHIGSNAFRQASTLLTLYAGEGYGVEEVDGCLTLGWQGRAVISASAWHSGDQLAASSVVNICFNHDNNHAISFTERGSADGGSSSRNIGGVDFRM